MLEGCQERGQLSQITGSFVQITYPLILLISSVEMTKSDCVHSQSLLEKYVHVEQLFTITVLLYTNYYSWTRSHLAIHGQNLCTKLSTSGTRPNVAVL